MTQEPYCFLKLSLHSLLGVSRAFVCDRKIQRKWLWHSVQTSNFISYLLGATIWWIQASSPKLNRGHVRVYSIWFGNSEFVSQTPNRICSGPFSNADVILKFYDFFPASLLQKYFSGSLWVKQKVFVHINSFMYTLSVCVGERGRSY